MSPKNNKIVLATGIYPPSVGGPATYTKLLHDELGQYGFETVVCSFDSVRKFPRLIRHVLYTFKLWRASADASLIYAQDPFSVGLPAFLVSRIRRTPYILKVVGDFAWEQAVNRFRYKKSLEDFQVDNKISYFVRTLRYTERFVARRSAKVIVPGVYLKDILKSWNLDDQPTVIYNSFEAEHVTVGVKTKRENQNQPFRIMTAGRLVAWKRIDDIIRAIGILRADGIDATLLIAGDGPERNKLQNLVKDSSLSNYVAFAGHLNQKTLHERISESDVFVLASSYEGLSHQLLEVRALGVPCIASDIVANKEVIENGVTGQLVPVGSVDDIAKAIKQFWDDPSFAEQCANNALIIPDKFQKEIMLSNLVEQIKSVKREIKENTANQRKTPKALMISTDASILMQGRSQTRMLRYATLFSRLDIVVMGCNKDMPASSHHERLHIYNSQSDSRFRSIFDAIKTSRKLLKEQKFNLVITQDPFETSFVAIFAKLLSGRFPKLFVQLHTDCFNKHFVRHSILNFCRAVFAVIVLIFFASRIRVVSERIAKSLRKLVIHKKIFVFPISIELSKFDKTTQVDPVIISVFRFEPEKNPIEVVGCIIKVLEKIPKAKAILVGEGSMKKDVERKVTNSQLSERISCVGKQSDMTEWYNKASIFFQASVYEGYGMALVEAGAHGLAIVTTDVGCVGELIKKDKDALVCAVGDWPNLTKKLMLVCEDAELRRSLGNHAREVCLAEIESNTDPLKGMRQYIY